MGPVWRNFGSSGAPARRELLGLDMRRAIYALRFTHLSSEMASFIAKRAWKWSFR